MCGVSPAAGLQVRLQRFGGHLRHARMRLFQPAKERIARMQAAGFSDQQIIDAFVRDYGPGIYLAQPSAFGWTVPYVAAALGLIGIWLFLKKYRKPKPLLELGPVAIDDPALDKYKDQIEKDLANLE